MDTLSSSMSTTFRIVPSLQYPPTKSHVRNPHHHHRLHFSSISSSAAAGARPPRTSATASVISPRKQRSDPSEESVTTHLINRHRASSGYAVALLDAARRSDALQLVSADVRRLRRAVEVGERAAEEIARRALKEGGYHRHLAKLVKMLIEKGKAEILSDVLSEFGRIYGELISGWSEPSAGAGADDNNTPVVLVPADLNLQENQAVEIARRVRQLSGGGAAKVVRQFFDQS